MSQLSFLEQLMQERSALTVSEFTAQLKIHVENRFVDAWVEGEISNFKRHSSGHWYFSMKDEGATLRCASFRMQNRLIRFTPEDGLRVRARGRISVYEARGEYQLIVDALEPLGIGALQLAFEQLKRRLDAEGLFDIARKRELPLLPRTIGVVTSPTGAALRDIVRVLTRRNAAVNILIAPARVQGEGAAAEIAQAIGNLTRQADVEVIIVGRGGGSVEDLWAFNEEAVARAIFASPVPVIAAIGHETDFTIADFVADLRASTPSAAAEIVSMARDEVVVRLAGLMQGMVTALRYQLIEAQNALAEAESSRAFLEVPARIKNLAQACDDAVYAMEAAFKESIKTRRAAHEKLKLRIRDANIRHQLASQLGAFAVLRTRLAAASRTRLDRDRERLAIAMGKLHSLSPLAVLARGYALAFDQQGRIIKRADKIQQGERLRVRLADGEIDCVKE
ncbi:MAG: exodeoxyribonuclease VII large subunit [Acidobacteria bacterium]|nr:exodeoxyribonuclease VII large subunit [Acidobacteriota bacterium]